MEHQFDLGSAVQPAPFVPSQDADAPLYASVEGVAQPLSNEEVMFQTRGADETLVMTTQVLTTLDQCRPFASLDEHVARVMRKVPGLEHHQNAREALDALARSSLLVSDAELFQHSRARQSSPASLAGLCIRACDRPACLEQLLASLRESHQRHEGAGHNVIVLDDSRDTDCARRNAELLREHGEAAGVATSYVGTAQQETLCQRLRAEFPDRVQAIGNLLARSGEGFSGGRMLNAALLLTAGRRLFLLDEDFVLPLKNHPEAQPGMSPGADDSKNAWFYADQTAAVAAGEPLPQDPFAMHLGVVGHTLGEVAAGGPWQLQREALHGKTMQDVRPLYEGYGLVTSFNGTRGDPGTGSLHWLYLLDPESRQRLCASREDYLRNLQSRSVWQSPAQALPVNQGYLLPFGVDNSKMLPCTRAHGRNEDALLNTLVRFCHPRTQGMQLPCTIGHMQDDERDKGRITDSQRVWQVNTNSFAYDTLLNHMDRCLSADPAQRLRFAADIFADVAGAAEQDRITHLREYLSYTRADLVANYQHLLVSVPDAPVYWQADVREMVAANAKAMNARMPPRLSDFPQQADAAGCAAHLAESMDELAEDLRAWPELWHWAAEQGEGLLASL